MAKGLTQSNPFLLPKALMHMHLKPRQTPDKQALNSGRNEFGAFEKKPRMFPHELVVFFVLSTKSKNRDKFFFPPNNFPIVCTTYWVVGN